MPFAFEQDPPGVRCALRCSGDIDADVLLEVVAYAVRHLTGPTPQCLVEGRQIQSLDLDPEGFARALQTGQELTRRLGPGRSAFVVPVRYHSLAQLYLIRMERHMKTVPETLLRRDFALFAEEQEALAWLAQANLEAPR
ncbi:MAG: hypothetical protein AAF809_15065 [Bacteroidota bacterium]